ncbi:MAG: twin-arginine translocase TatA/TatE family subunit [Victivallales bacterium]|nr:twin-arginine translocase TatA/TatE family subunit [Victivallales bacterium]
MSLGPGEIIVIVLIVLLLFGAKRIPELARSLGRASYEFKKAKHELEAEGKELVDTAEDVAKKEDENTNQKES